MSEELLKAVRDLDAHRKYLDTVLNEYRNIVEAVAPSVELTDNNRRRVPVTLIGPSHRTHLNNAKEAALERYHAATQRHQRRSQRHLDHQIQRPHDAQEPRG
jgi:subtilisin-like proprotein convertase family protein